MKASKEQIENESVVRGLLEPTKQKTKREEQIDKKIEYLLETYKRQDEELVKKSEDEE